MQYHRKIKHFFSWKNAYHFVRWRLFRPAKWRFNKLYNRLNKLYLKSDLSKDYMHASEAKKILEQPNIHWFRSLITLENNDIIKSLVSSTGKGQIKYFSMDDIKDELLRRECACWKDYALYRKELYCRPKYRRAHKRCLKAKIEKIVLKINGKEYTLGKFNTKLRPKLMRIIKEIYEHIDLFDPNNPNYISPENICYIGDKITAKNIDEIDPIKTLLDSPLKW